MPVALGLIAALPALLGRIGLPGGLQNLVAWGRWPLLLMLAIIGFEALYGVAPNRARPRWRWISIGSGAAAILWLGGFGLFPFYVSNFCKYNQTYGSLAAIVILLLWFYLSAYAVLIGAEFNAEAERRAREIEVAAGERRPGARAAP